MRTSTLVLLLAGVAAAQDNPAAKDDPKAVVKRAVISHGGAEALGKFATSAITGKGTMTAFGGQFPFTSDVTVQLPDKFRAVLTTEVAGQKIEIVQTANGTKLAQTTNGKPSEVSPEERKELAQVLVMQEIAILTPLLTDRFTLKPEVSIEPGVAVMVATPAAGGNPITLRFDTKTGYLVGHSRDAVAPGDKGGTKKVREDNVLSDFKKLDGVMVATKVTSTHDGKPFMTMTVTEAKAVPAADAKLFEVK